VRVITPARLLVLALACLTAGLGAWSLTTEGLETYYAAGVRSMAGSWHNFFFGAFDLRGTITLDKLPGALWLQALSVRAFGYSVWAMVLPQVLETALTVPALYRAVRRVSGTRAGLVAAGLFAVTPVVVSSTRGNLSEPLYLLCLVLAADAILRAITRNRRRSVLMAAFWVAVGFQAKMAEAWLVLPALAVALVVGLRPGVGSGVGTGAAGRGRGRGRGVLWAGVLGLLTVALSLVWVVAVTLTPAASRPVVDGSAHNSEFEQVFRYNGVSRLDDNNLFGLERLGAPSAQAEEAAQAEERDPEYAASLLASYRSQPSWDRLFAGVLAPDCAWLVPGALAGALLVLRRRSAMWRRSRKEAGRRADPVRAAAWLWVVWAVTFGVVLSSAHLLHDYYLATLVPPLAALTGTGLSRWWSAARTGGRRASRLLPALLVIEAGWSASLLCGHGEVVAGVAVACAGLVAAVGATLLFRPRPRDAASATPSRADPHPRPRPSPRPRLRALGVTVTALAVGVATVLGPVVADVWLLKRAGGAFDTPLASGGTLARPTPAEAAVRARFKGYGGGVRASFSRAGWNELMEKDRLIQEEGALRGRRILVFASSVAADYVMGGVSAVEPVGGFTGDVPFPTADRIQTEIQSGQISFALVPSSDMLLSNDPRVKMIEALCRPLTAGEAWESYACR
jgi:4-amino-4-deoxy-L-arabinose transferase-like glycosyltransferase